MSQRIDFKIDQGTDFNFEVELYDENDDPLDVSDYEAEGKLRKSYTSNTAYSFSCFLTEGSLAFSMNHVMTSNITPGRYVYDMELIDTVSNTVTRIMEGIVTVTPEATR